MTSESSRIYDNVQRALEQVEEAALRAGRKPEEITLMGVTKTQSAEDIKTMIAAGISTLGENRVQEWLQKKPLLEDSTYTCHLIGHLQKNKAKFLPGNFASLHSLDSEKTMLALERIYAEAGEVLDVLLEVNIGGESSKNGLLPEEVGAFAEKVCACKHLHLRGLMTIPPFEEPEKVRPYFKQMYNLFVDIQGKKMDNSTVNILSMGMSSDFETAIEEGATIVRVGTGIFGPRG